jgi:hypothetical protein
MTAAATQAAHTDWRAGLALLTSRFPEEFGRRRVEHANADGQPLRVLHGHVNLERLSDEELDQLEELLVRALPDDDNVVELPQRAAS